MQRKIQLLIIILYGSPCILHIYVLNLISFRLENLEETIISNNVKLIIVDSIASLARKEFGGHHLITERNNMLIKEATLLKYLLFVSIRSR